MHTQIDAEIAWTSRRVVSLRLRFASSFLTTLHIRTTDERQVNQSVRQTVIASVSADTQNSTCGTLEVSTRRTGNEATTCETPVASREALRMSVHRHGCPLLVFSCRG